MRTALSLVPLMMATMQLWLETFYGMFVWLFHRIIKENLKMKARILLKIVDVDWTWAEKVRLLRLL